MTKEGKLYKADIIKRVKAATPQNFYLDPTSDRVEMKILIWFAMNNRDISNCLKILEDGIAEALEFNDKIVYHLDVWKGLDRRYPRIGVWIRPMGETEYPEEMITNYGIEQLYFQ